MSNVVDFTAAKMARLRAEVKARRETGAYGSASGARTMQRLMTDTSRRRGARWRCPCCHKPMTHAGLGDGVTLIAGCEKLVAAWAKDPDAAAHLIMAARLANADRGPCVFCGELVVVPPTMAAEAGKVLGQRRHVRLVEKPGGDIVERTRRGQARVFIHNVCGRPT